MKMDTFWEESLGHRLKVERNLNFSTINNEDDEFGFSRKKTARDPMSHRIIEKRRRDRMNNCLADLSRLVPTNYLKKGRGRIEKTEIIEMAIKHLKHLQAHPCKNPATCEVAKTTEQNHKHQYRLGFQECMSEAVRFLVEIEGFYANDGLCFRLVNHLQKHYDKVSGGMCYTQALGMMHSEEGKAAPMETEQTSSGFPTENYPENPADHSDQVKQTSEIELCERNCSVEETIKQEISTVHTIQGSFHEPVEVSENAVASKALSQLSSMLQNTMSTKDSTEGIATGNSSSENCEQAVGNPAEYVIESSLPENARRIDVYKFKNNIKHRFNADLQQHSTAPTDSHSDQTWLEEQTHSELRGGQESINTNNHLGPLVVPERYPSDNRNNPSFTPPPTAESNAELSPPNAALPPGELSVKIPEKCVSDSRATHCNNWDCQGDTGSSCGSNFSPQAPRRPNGSSSGYSTGGEMPPGSKMKIQTPDHQSPALSPYSHTPDHIPSQSPSPQPTAHTMGIPIFALHPRGTFYIPLTIDSSLVTPYLSGIEEISPVLHPISICVNFSVSHWVKPDKIDGTAVHFYGHSLFVDKFQDRYTGGDRHSYYPCSPAQN